MFWFRKSAPSDSLAVTMTGVKLGDRVLAVGLTDTAMIAALAQKTGLTGRMAAVDADEARAERGGRAIEREGALVDVTRAPWGMLPYDDDSFDVVVARDVLMTLPPAERGDSVAEWRRVLRPGGRVIVIERAPRAGLAGLLNRSVAEADSAAGGGAAAMLEAKGFAGVRVLAEREGTRFIEGAKPGATSRT